MLEKKPITREILVCSFCGQTYELNAQDTWHCKTDPPPHNFAVGQVVQVELETKYGEPTLRNLPSIKTAWLKCTIKAFAIGKPQERRSHTILGREFGSHNHGWMVEVTLNPGQDALIKESGVDELNDAKSSGKESILKNIEHIRALDAGVEE